ncbi:MAG: IPExxxVDY family protein [Bacteroidales bacterium]|jgi:hypothetical protein|nr:IPExxxVDY family protein [Bacteroidales bacterium]
MSRERKITRHTIESAAPKTFFFLGVVSAEPDYRLSVMINRHLGTDLRKCPEDIIIETATGTRNFSRFSPENRAFALVSNRSGGSVFLKKLKNIDYLLVPAQQDDVKTAEQFAASLRIIPEITAVFILDSRETTDRNIALLAQ